MAGGNGWFRLCEPFCVGFELRQTATDRGVAMLGWPYPPVALCGCRVAAAEHRCARRRARRPDADVCRSDARSAAVAGAVAVTCARGWGVVARAAHSPRHADSHVEPDVDSHVDTHAFATCHAAAH